MNLSQESVWAAGIIAVPVVVFGIFEVVTVVRRRRRGAVARRSKEPRRPPPSPIPPSPGA